jgi:hypothetical protein
MHSTAVHAAAPPMHAAAAVAMAAAPHLRQKVIVHVGGGVRSADNLDRFRLRQSKGA